MYIDDIYTLDLELMRSLKIKAFIFDIDNTLVTYDDLDAPEHTKLWFDMLHENGFKTCLVSNNNEKRVSRFARSLGEKYYSRALKPRRMYLSRALEDLGVKPENSALVGDQLFTDICGGRRMGMYTILVKPVSDKDVWFVHFKRYIENLILKRGSYENNRY